MGGGGKTSELLCTEPWSINRDTVEDIREDVYSCTGSIFIRDTAWDTAYSL